ncbi:DUF1189 family protein [Facklamia hominis]
MKRTFLILKAALSNPRYFIEGIDLAWSKHVILALIVTLFMALNTFIAIRPSYQNLLDNIGQADTHVPKFQVKNEELQLASGEKSLYYHSAPFQLVVDDQLVNHSTDGGLILNNEDAEKISSNSLVNLILSKDQILFYLKGQNQLMTFDYQIIPNEASLHQSLDLLRMSKPLVFFSTFLLSFLFYAYLIALTTLFSGILNFWLNTPLTFSYRLKLVIMCSFFPLIFLQIIQMFLPNFYLPIFAIVVLILMIAYYAFKRHTLFIREVMQKIQTIDKDEFARLVNEDPKSLHEYLAGPDQADLIDQKEIDEIQEFIKASKDKSDKNSKDNSKENHDHHEE